MEVVKVGVRLMLGRSKAILLEVMWDRFSNFNVRLLS